MLGRAQSRMVPTDMMGPVAFHAGNSPPVARDMDPHHGPHRMDHIEYLVELEAPGVTACPTSGISFSF